MRYNRIMKTHTGIGARIRQARRAIGVTQAEIAARIQRPRESVTRWETGEREPCWRNVQALADALSCSAAWLAFGRDDHSLV